MDFLQMECTVTLVTIHHCIDLLQIASTEQLLPITQCIDFLQIESSSRRQISTSPLHLLSSCKLISISRNNFPSTSTFEL